MEKLKMVAGLFALVFSPSLLAALPTPVAPSTAPAAGDWLGFVTGWADDAGTALGLVLGMVAFAWVSWSLIAKFNEARQGKAEWGEVGLLVVVGGVILIFEVYMLTESAAVI